MRALWMLALREVTSTSTVPEKSKAAIDVSSGVRRVPTLCTTLTA